MVEGNGWDMGDEEGSVRDGWERGRPLMDDGGHQLVVLMSFLHERNVARHKLVSLYVVRTLSSVVELRVEGKYTFQLETPL